MTSLVFGHDETVVEWALNRQPESLTAFGQHWVIGLVNNQGVLRGAVVIAQNSPTGVIIGVECDQVITRAAIRDTFAFIFGHLGASRCEMVTRKSNKAMKKHAPRVLGFAFEGVRRDWYGPGEDGLAFFMTPATCKWIETDGIPLAA